MDITGLGVRIAGARLLHDIDLHAGSGELVGVVGPNGSGKSTLLKCVYRAVRPNEGTVRVAETELFSLPLSASARLVAAMPQEAVPEFDHTVAEMVEMGRLPHQSGSGRSRPADREICARAIERVGVSHLADRGVLSLSGGERQRVLIARALAQQADVLVLDEPTNHLDIAHQLDVLGLVRGSGPTVLTALHDLNLAASYCDRLYVLSGGQVVAAGTPDEVLDDALLREVFGVCAHRVRHPRTGAVQLLFDQAGGADQ